MTTENLSMLAAVADRVGRDHAATDAAAAERLAESATILLEVIAALRGAWRAMASRVGTASTMSAAGTTTEHASWTGLYLAGDGPKQVAPVLVGGTNASRGKYAGTRLFLRGYDGKLVQLVYSGTWSTVPGEVSSWRSMEREVTAVDAVELYGLASLVEALEKSLRAQEQGKTTDRARQFREEAERLRAVLVLLRSSR